MLIDWTAAPEGTTHATINGGEPRWYQEALGGMNCWNVANATWFQSFFSSPSDIEDNGLRLYALGEQTELVMLREQRDALWSCLNDIIGAWLSQNDDAMATLMVSTAHLVDNTGPGLEGTK